MPALYITWDVSTLLKSGIFAIPYIVSIIPIKVSNGQFLRRFMLNVLIKSKC